QHRGRRSMPRSTGELLNLGRPVHRLGAFLPRASRLTPSRRVMFRMLRFVACGMCLMAAICARGGAAEPAARFETDVWPILKAHCFQCHGEDEKPKGGLDLRLARLILAGGESGAA